MGTIGSLRLLKSKLKKTFVVSNCDILLKTDFDNILSFSQRKEKCPYNRGICKAL